MMLTSALVEQTLTQFNAEVLPGNHPELNRLFGEHTFFLDSGGLNIIEPMGPTDEGAIEARVVKVASWKDGSKTGLTRHEPEPTEVVVALEPDELGSLH
jgi:hypothetical protein